ncbi:hypothetical protein EJ08DRAFT_451973 [Tothia fuscella]|uniref:Glycine zipper 2TM domain-containing protein n=1 Tax=Tothia fuscella TaxID=1048955 RepID=A0A9P4NIS5_9PEZI|nr:hypothetical protein EJ08DRAFT_451973 [Tothia fuscella]
MALAKATKERAVIFLGRKATKQWHLLMFLNLPNNELPLNHAKTNTNVPQQMFELISVTTTIMTKAMPQILLLADHAEVHFPHVRMNPPMPYPDELPKDSNHIYPPPPPQVRNDPAGRQPYGPPFNQQPFGAPPVPQAYGVAPGPRGYAGLPLYVPYPAQQTNNNQRTNTPNPASGRDTHDQRGDSLSRERRRERNRDSRDSGSSRRSKDHKPKDRSIAASLAGAVAGGLVGHQAGKGDILATAAGALVGALGGGMAADKHVQAKYKRDESDKDWQRQHGR